MKRFASILAIACGALALAGCGGDEESKEAEKKRGREDDSSVPLLIPCEACKKEVSKKTDKCPDCGHPAADSVVAYLKEQERIARLAEEESEREKGMQQQVEEAQRMQDLQIVAKGPIKEMIIQMDDGPSERMTDIAQGEILPFKFSKSFKGAATEMENISLVIDGATYRLPEKGKGNFSWPAD